MNLLRCGTFVAPLNKNIFFFSSNFKNSKSVWPNYPVNPNVAVFLFTEPTFFSAFLLFLLSDKLSDWWFHNLDKHNKYWHSIIASWASRGTLILCRPKDAL